MLLSSLQGCKLAKKPTPAEIELQLSERRFILEAMSSAATLIQVPVVTAFVWWAMSERSTTLRRLNKAILIAELSPKIGDITFPPGVVLGAAAESLDDMEKLLAGLGETVGEIAEKGTEFATDVIFDILVPKSLSCIQLEQEQRDIRIEVLRAQRLEKYPGEVTILKFKWAGVLTKLKEKCPEIYAGLAVTQ